MLDGVLDLNLNPNLTSPHDASDWMKKGNKNAETETDAKKRNGKAVSHPAKKS